MELGVSTHESLRVLGPGSTGLWPCLRPFDTHTSEAVHSLISRNTKTPYTWSFCITNPRGGRQVLR